MSHVFIILYYSSALIMQNSLHWFPSELQDQKLTLSLRLSWNLEVSIWEQKKALRIMLWLVNIYYLFAVLDCLKEMSCLNFDKHRFTVHAI